MPSNQTNYDELVKKLVEAKLKRDANKKQSAINILEQLRKANSAKEAKESAVYKDFILWLSKKKLEEKSNQDNLLEKLLLQNALESACTNVEKEPGSIVIKISGKGLETLKKLKLVTNANGFQNVVEDALIVYKTLIEYKKKGYKIQLNDGTGKPKELVLPVGE